MRSVRLCLKKMNRIIKNYGLVLFCSLLVWAGCPCCHADQKDSAENLSFTDLKKEQTAILRQFEAADFKNETFDLSQSLKSFEGKKVAIEGYIISGGMLQDKSYEFLLAESPWDFCCQGVPPTPFTSLYLKSGSPFLFERTSVVRIEGVLKKKIFRNTSGQIESLFVLENAEQKKVVFRFNPDYFPLVLILLYLIYRIVKKTIQRQKKTWKKAEGERLSDKILVRTENLAVGYRRKAVLSSINLEIVKSGSLGIIGPNGSGKTTFIRTLMGIIPPTDGKIQKRPDLKFGYVMQRQFVENLYPFRVRDMVLMGRYGLLNAPKRPGKMDFSIVEESLELTGIHDLKEVPFRELSGGQKQRVLIARAMCSQPDILILDEPTNDMDLEGEESVINLIKSIQQEKHTSVVIISHLLPVVLNLCSRFMFLEGNNRHQIFSLEDLIEKDALARLYKVPVSIIADSGRYSIHIRGREEHV